MCAHLPLVALAQEHKQPMMDRLFAQALGQLNWHYGWRALLVCLGYMAGARLGLLMPYVNEQITLIWPPTGIAIAALLWWGPGMLLPLIIGSLGASLWIGSSWPLALAIALGNGCGPWLAVQLLQRCNFNRDFRQRRDFLLFVAIAAVGGMLLTASNGVSQLWLFGLLTAAELPKAFASWWLGDAMGVLVVGLPLLTFSRNRLAALYRGWRGLELLLVLSLTLLASYLLFISPLHHELVAPSLLPLLLLLWLALRGNLWLALMGNLAVAVLVLLGTLEHSHFIGLGEHSNAMLQACGYILAITTIITLITLLTTEVKDTEERWRSALEGSELGVWEYDFDRDHLQLSPQWTAMLGYTEEPPPATSGGWLALMHPDDLPQFRAVLIAHLHGHSNRYRSEFRLRRRNGHWCWISGQGKVVSRHANGRAQRMVGTTADITPVKRAEAAVTALKDFYAAVLTNIRSAVAVTDTEHCVRYSNKALAEMLDVPGDALLGLQLPEQLPGYSGGQLQQLYRQACDEQRPLPYRELALTTANGERRFCNGWLIPLYEHGHFDGLLLTFEDMTAQLEAERQLRHAASVFDTSLAAIMICQPDGTITQVNPAFTVITGYTAEEALGHTPRLLKSGRHDEAFYQQLWCSLESEGRWQGELWNRRKNGEIYIARQVITAVKDAQGQAINYVSMIDDISLQKESEEQIRLMAYYDALTGLPNRSLLNDRAEQLFASAERADMMIAVLFIDLDHFKTVNDSLGHLAGDCLLVTVSRRLENCLREEDTVGRLGGDEFLVLARCHNADDAALIAGRVIAAVDQPMTLENQAVTLTPSIGIALYPRDGQNFNELLKHADSALYRAKDGGRNGYHFFLPEMQQAALNRLLLENELRQAIEQRQLQIHLQPQLSLATGAVIGAEALVRWYHPERGLIGPDLFIPVAEQSGLIIALGDYVLNDALHWLKIFNQAGHSLHFAVNLSVRQLANAQFSQQLQQRLAEHDIHARQLELELTESMLASEVPAVRQQLLELQRLGVQLSIDDFGTGYSSLSYLKAFPIAKLKIDRSFVMDLLTDDDDRAITRAIIDMGHALGLRIIAEGVEQQAQAELLGRLGCDEIQGYLLSKPLPPAALLAWLHQRQSLTA